jgi:hypothetical protein
MQNSIDAACDIICATTNEDKFEYVESLLETDKAEAVYSLKKSNAIRESYEKATLIGNHDLASLNAPVGAIEDATQTADSYDDEDAGF